MTMVNEQTSFFPKGMGPSSRLLNMPICRNADACPGWRAYPVYIACCLYIVYLYGMLKSIEEWYRSKFHQGYDPSSKSPYEGYTLFEIDIDSFKSSREKRVSSPYIIPVELAESLDLLMHIRDDVFENQQIYLLDEQLRYAVMTNNLTLALFQTESYTREVYTETPYICIKVPVLIKNVNGNLVFIMEEVWLDTMVTFPEKVLHALEIRLRVDWKLTEGPTFVPCTLSFIYHAACTMPKGP